MLNVNAGDLELFRQTMAHARFERYVDTCDGNAALAHQLYYWNTRISQAFFGPIQIWEIGLRNQMNRFLLRQHRGDWTRKREIRFQNADQVRLDEAIRRKSEQLGEDNLTNDAVISDLSAAFWVSMLSKKGNSRYAWQNNMLRVFPNAPRAWRLPTTPGVVKWDHVIPHGLCEDILNLRNRIAHHEAIYSMPLMELHEDLRTVVGAMCSASLSYLDATSEVPNVLNERPA